MAEDAVLNAQSSGTRTTTGDNSQEESLRTESYPSDPTTQEHVTEGVPDTKQKPQESALKMKTKAFLKTFDAPTVAMMFKGSLPPTIAIAFYQSDAISNLFPTLGYLIPIISVICICIMPRAKYIQMLILNIISICLGSAIALLGIWSGVEARKNTTPPGVRAAYNSSQAAVCAIWLFVNIWFANVMRAKVPALQFPVMMYSIFTNVAFTFGPLFQTIEQGEALILQLLEGFLFAFAISTGVSLFIIPVSSRAVVFKEAAGYIGAIRGTIKAETALLQSLENSDMFSTGVGSAGKPKKDKKSSGKSGKNVHAPVEASPESKALKGILAGLTALHGKLHGDLQFAKREFAYGKLGAKDLDEIYVRFREILIPLIGMGTISDIFERIAERRGWVHPTGNTNLDSVEAWEQDPNNKAKLEEKRIWNQVMKQLHEPFAVVAAAMDEGLEHAGILLELIPKPKAKKSTSTEDADVEAKGDSVRPGDIGFADVLQKKMKEFYNGRGETLKTWAREKNLPETQFDSTDPFPANTSDTTQDEGTRLREQQQLYLILYMEHLLYSTGTAVANFVRFAESKHEDGTMKKKRIIRPGPRRLMKWLKNIGNEDSTVSSDTPDSSESGINIVHLGAGFGGRRDPEHLPPKSAWEKFGNGVRAVPRFLASVESAFGFRVACATMSIGIVAFLESTQTFFIEQRLVWAMIIIAIGMTVTTGQSIFGFFGRIAGTALSMVLSLIIWYIVDSKLPGVIVMTWFFIFLEYYLFIKYPRFIAIWLVCIVTQVLIIGYELQVEKIGIERASASGQPFYPIYELAPYRLACVAGGSLVAFIWTIFPFPLTDRSVLRKDLGATIYLLANYYSAVHSTIGARIYQTEGDMTDKRSPGRKLQKVRGKVFGKLLLLLPSLQQHADWQKWEPSIGGRFPQETYTAITERLTNIMHYLSLMSYTTQTLSLELSDPEANSTRGVWLKDLSQLLTEIGPTSHSITSTLSLLSASVTQGSALPPYMQMPEPYHIWRRLEKLDRGILDSRHVAEPGYAAIAVMQVAASLVTDDLRRLVEHVKDLVGETDFSFQVISVGEGVDGTDSEGSVRKGKRD